jgi:dephospho-CoA kinase
MIIYGITGPSGAGKSLLGEYCAAHGIPHLDADAIYHELLIPPSEAVDALTEAFGHGILDTKGGIDRAALSAIVFRDEQKLALLNRTVLTIVLREIRRRLNALRAEGIAAVAVDAPTLIESGFDCECDAVIAVLSSPEIRIARIMERDGLSRERAEERVKAQKPDEFYCSVADTVFQNNGDCNALFACFEAFLESTKERKTIE